MVRMIFSSGSLASPARIIWRFHSRIRRSKKRGPLPRPQLQRRSTRLRLSILPSAIQNETGLRVYRSIGCGERRTRRTYVRRFASHRSARPFDCKQWGRTPGLANYARATNPPGAAPTPHSAHNFGCCDYPSTGSRLRTINKRNTLVGPQLQPGDRVYCGLETAIAFLAVIVLGAIVATQVLANSFGFHRSLGFNLFHVYPPWGYFQWSHQWEESEQSCTLCPSFWD